MQIQVNTDNIIEGKGMLIHRVESQVSEALARFSSHLTRVEVHLGDENAGKSGSADKRCMIEARLSGQQPVIVTHHAATLEEACNGAVSKLRSLLDSKFGRMNDHKGDASIRDNEQR